MHRWWERGIVYQIYPRSFQDSTGDGVGDLEGARRRLPHLAGLGVDAVWLSPIYPSPMADFGYDVADYVGVDPLFGSLDDFDRFAEEARRLGLRVILDFVPNHTSIAHPWFRESRASRANPKRDWYIWRDPAPGGGPPNNWISNFGGPAWTFDEGTGQYWHHAFLPEQPDLNWRNPQVREAMYEALRFWMRRGVDGFRVDVIWHLLKDPLLRDNPPNPDWRPGDPEIGKLLQLRSADQPGIVELVAEMRAVLEEFGDKVLIGEIYLPLERLVAYYGENLEAAHLPFNFQLLDAPWTAKTVRDLVADYEDAIPEGGWPNWVLGNHDKPRVASRVGAAQARVAAMLLLTLRGTPTLYYGDEIGLADVPVPPERAQDPWGRNEPGRGRDPQRTPMQWDASPNAGFCPEGVEPWLPLSADRAARNVHALDADPTSILSLHRRLIALRRATPALSVGRYGRVAREGEVLSFSRVAPGERVVVALNFSGEPHAVDGLAPEGRIAVSTHGDREGEPVSGAIALRPDEGVVVIC